MVIFTSFGRRRTGSPPEPRRQEVGDDVRRALPARFEAVAEALMSLADTTPACAEAGRGVAADGAALGEALDGLRITFDRVVGRDPDFASMEALSVAWSEATLEYLHDLTCEDPLTGMASFAHVRTRIDELYREAEQSATPVARSHALVIVELSSVEGPARGEHRFTRALHLVQVTEAVRSVFPGEETIGRLSVDRAVAVARRGPRLGVDVTGLRDLLGELDLGSTRVRVWIEGLPRKLPAAIRLLDDLAR